MQATSIVNVTASNLRKLGLAPEQVVYVGRGGRFHKWPHHPLANPFKPGDIRYRSMPHDAAVSCCLLDYRAWLLGNIGRGCDPLAALWEECEHGVKPLGCWCVSAEYGDGQAVVCHAQILSEELHKRFVEGNTCLM